MRSILALALVVSQNAYAVAPGATEALVGFLGAKDMYNVAVTEDDGWLWLALETSDDVVINERGLELYKYDTVGLGVGGTILQSFSDLTNDGMYPTLMTWDAADNVIVVGKEDLLQTEAHLQVWTQDRDNFSNAPSSQAVTSTAGGYEHSKPHMARDRLNRSNSCVGRGRTVWVLKTCGRSQRMPLLGFQARTAQFLPRVTWRTIA